MWSLSFTCWIIMIKMAWQVHFLYETERKAAISLQASTFHFLCPNITHQPGTFLVNRNWLSTLVALLNISFVYENVWANTWYFQALLDWDFWNTIFSGLDSLIHTIFILLIHTIFIVFYSLQSHSKHLNLHWMQHGGFWWIHDCSINVIS